MGFLTGSKQDHKWSCQLILCLVVLLCLFSVHQASASEEFNYDDRGRLVGVTYDDGTQLIYRYDEAGNRSEHIVSPTTLVQFHFAEDDAVETIQAQPILILPLANDTAGGTTTLTVVSTGVTDNGSIFVPTDGLSISYDPHPNFAGVDSFVYTVSDDPNCITYSAACVYATATVTVTVENVPPKAFSDIVSPDSTSFDFDPRANDSDPQLVPLELTYIDLPSCLNMTPLLDTFHFESGCGTTQEFSYGVSDLHGATADAEIRMMFPCNTFGGYPQVGGTITGVNDNALLPLDPSALAPHTNDNGLGDQYSTFFVDIGNARFGTATPDLAGNYWYQARSGFQGRERLRASARDGCWQLRSGHINVQMEYGFPFPPSAGMDSAQLNAANTVATFDDVLSNDYGDGLIVYDVQGGAFGSGAPGQNGNEIIYTVGLPGQVTSDFHDTLTYTIIDSNSLTSTGTLHVYASNALNTDPVPADDFITGLAPNTTQLLDVLFNDDDADGDEMVVVVDYYFTDGYAVSYPPGQIAYTPNPGFVGTDTIRYTLLDENGGQSSSYATVTVSVDGIPNGAPVVADQATTVSTGTTASLDVLQNATDPEGDLLFVSGVAQPFHGFAEIDLVSGLVKYTPEDDFIGLTRLEYWIADGQGNATGGTVEITVEQGTNTPPIANTDIYHDIPAGATEPFDVLANDTDADNGSLTIISVQNPTGGTASITGGGTGISYTSFAGTGGRELFSYRISDGQGGEATGVIVAYVGNLPPSAGNDVQHIPIGIDNFIKFDPLANDIDNEGSAIWITDVGVPDGVNPKGTAVHTNGGNCIVYTLDSLLTPPNQFDTIEYTITDGVSEDTAYVFIYYDDEQTTFPSCSGTGGAGGPGLPNRSPIAENDGFLVPIQIAFDASATLISVLSNDSDQDDDPLNVSAIIQPPGNGVVTIAGNGLSVSYTPNTGYSGPDAFIYEIQDGDLAADTATVSLQVAEDPNPNLPPAANDDGSPTPLVIYHNTPTSIDVLANDTDAELDALVVTFVVQDAASGTATVGQDGLGVDYIPNSGFIGADSFQYEIFDGAGGSDTASVFLDVAAPNEPPVANLDGVPVFIEIAHDTATAIDVLVNDTDADLDALLVNAIAVDPVYGNADITNVGSDVTYTPNSGYVGSDFFSYQVTDGNGGYDIANVSLNVVAPNQAPVANADGTPTAVAVTENIAVVIDVLANDTDPESDPLLVSQITVQGTNGAAAVTNAGADVTYTPNASYVGSDTFTYEVSDGQGGLATAVVTVDVTAVPNLAPVANADGTPTAIAVVEDVATVIDVLANDTDPDSDPLVVSQITLQGTNGAASVTNAGADVTYTPNANYVGSDTFTYEASDGHGGLATAIVTVDVTAAPNQTPVANADGTPTAIAVVEDVATVIDVLANDTDPDSDPLVVSQITVQGTNGAAAVTNAGADVTYTPNASYMGSDTFTYEVSDGNGGLATAVVTIDVTAAPNQAPVAVDDGSPTPIAIGANSTTNITVLANDSDPDGDPIIISAITAQPANGSVTIVQSGSKARYNPANTFSGIDSFTYEISDGNGGTDTATVTVDVAVATNAPPNAVNDSGQTFNGGTNATVNVLANDSDPDGDTLTITNTGGGVLLTNGVSVRFTVTVAEGQSQNFNYTISDGNGGSDSATVTVTRSIGETNGCQPNCN